MIKKPRKKELLDELEAIEKKEMAKKLEELKDIDSSLTSRLKEKEVKVHNHIMYGDFFIKFIIAISIGLAFMYTVIQGVHNGSVGTKASVHFQMISVLGPLFGAVLQYYFGKNKAGANGE